MQARPKLEIRVRVLHSTFSDNTTNARSKSHIAICCRSERNRSHAAMQRPTCTYSIITVVSVSSDIPMSRKISTRFHNHPPSTLFTILTILFYFFILLRSAKCITPAYNHCFSIGHSYRTAFFHDFIIVHTQDLQPSRGRWSYYVRTTYLNE